MSWLERRRQVGRGAGSNRRRLVQGLRPGRHIACSSTIFNVEYAPAGAPIEAVVLQLSGQVALVDMRCATPVAVLDGHSGGTNVASFSSSGALFVGDEGGQVTQWALARGGSEPVTRQQAVRQAPGWSMEVKSIEVLPCGRLLTAGTDGAVKLWDSGWGSRLLIDAELVYRVRLSPDCRTLALTLDTCMIILLKNFSADKPMPWTLSAVFALLQLLETGQTEGRAVRFADAVLEASEPNSVELLAVPVDTRPSSICFSPDGRTLAARCDGQQGGSATLVYSLAGPNPLDAVLAAEGYVGWGLAAGQAALQAFTKGGEALPDPCRQPLTALEEAADAPEFIKEICFASEAVAGGRALLCSPYRSGVRVVDTSVLARDGFTPQALAAPRVASGAADNVVLTCKTSPSVPELVMGGTGGSVSVCHPYQA